MAEQQISPDFPFTLHRLKTLNAEMAYVDTAPGRTSERDPTLLFLHGNPTSSYLWRNIIPHASKHARCIAPDLIGMGASDKPDLAYRFIEHALYLDEFIAAVVPRTQPVVLVIHDWGSALGLHWARRNAYRVAGLVLMEFLPPLDWKHFDEGGTGETFRAFRTPDVGRKMIIEENFFVEKFMPSGVVRHLTEKEMQYYRTPYPDGRSREPLYRWPNEIGIEGKPADVAAIIEAYHTWLLKSDVPKLFFYATPGAIIGEELAGEYQRNLKNVRSVHIGPGRHWIQEDKPHLIGSEIEQWIEHLFFSKGGKSTI